MKIKQFQDKNLSHYSYAILSESERQVVLIDPSRNPDQYYKFSAESEAVIIGVIETHPHADFVSSHLEIHQQTGAKIYGSKLIKASFPIVGFDNGDFIEFGKIKLKALNTPGHSPDSISVVLEYDGKDKAVFTGDTLFIGDCGRPDLRESDGARESLLENLSRKMYTSLRDKLMKLDDDVLVYPAHGAGTLCGKALSKANSSTIGAEKISNWSLQAMSEEQFVKKMKTDLPFIPAYFPFDVELNKKGALAFSESVNNVPIGDSIKAETAAKRLQKDLWVVDVRDEKQFKKGHLAHSVNIMEAEKFETWLGTIIKPYEDFYLAANHADQLKKMIERAAAIGYEQQIREAFILDYAQQQNEIFDVDKFRKHQKDYTIVDVRNPAEVKEKEVFSGSINIPLPELRGRIDEIPMNKPIVVHCAGGYRSAAASSLISSEVNGAANVYDMGEVIEEFQ